MKYKCDSQVKAMADKWPDQYLHITECRSGEQWIVPLKSNARLDLKRWVKRWIKTEFSDELFLDGDLTPKIAGAYYATIITDGRPPDCAIVWNSGGFYLK